MKKKNAGKNKFFSIVNGKVSQSLGIFFFFFFLTNEQKFETFFSSYKIKYFKSSAIDTTLSQQTLWLKLGYDLIKVVFMGPLLGSHIL